MNGMVGTRGKCGLRLERMEEYQLRIENGGMDQLSQA